MSRPSLLLLVAVASFLASPAGALAQAGTSYAFLVGCSGYDRTQLRPLPSPINDVEEFKKALLATGFEADHIKMLHDKQGDQRFLSEKAKILKELAVLLEGIRPNDTLVVALSGHGVHFKGDRTGYFCPVDAKLNDKNTLIAMEGPGGLFDLLKNCKARRKLLIVNACRNDPSSDLAQAANRVNLDDEDGDQVPEGIAAIYSCKQGQKSYYDDRRNLGIFFDHVIRSWKGEYVRGDNELTLESFFDQVITKTKTDVDRTLGESQIPVVRREYNGGAWPLGLPKKVNPEEAFRQAFRLDYGLGEKVDKVAALKLYREAMRAGHVLATVEVAGSFHSCIGGQTYDLAECHRLASKVKPEVERMARTGDGLAMFYLGNIHCAGLAGETNIREGARWYKSAIDKNIIPAMVYLAGLYIGSDGIEKNPKEALRLITKAAELGSPDAHHSIGAMYEFGIEVDKNAARAFQEYLKSAEQNLPLGQVTVGVAYLNGFGVSQDKPRGIQYIRKAAEQVDPTALYLLGMLYLEGNDVRKDEIFALECLHKSAERNNADAKNNLGHIHRRGLGVPVDMKQAADWYRKAVEQKHNEARVSLGWLLADGGTGVNKDEVAAVKLFRLAAEDHDANGQNSLGAMYRDGRGGLSRDDTAAVDWFSKSAAQDFDFGLFNLGAMYELGRGVTMNRDRAIELYRKAAEKGVSGAINRLKALNQSVPEVKK